MIKKDSNEEEDYLKNAKEVKDGISLVKKYENLLKSANKRIINIVRKQGEILKKNFWLRWSSRSNIYFKIRLHKFLCKFPVLKKSILTPSYFKSNFKIIRKVCNSNAGVFGERR